MTRYRLPRSLQVKLLAIGLGIGAQGALGWFMVKSGLDEQIVTDKAVPRVSQYRLAAHLGAALTLYMGMVSTAIGLRQHVKGVNALRRGETLPTLLRTPALGRFKGIVHLAYGMVFFTAVSGAFVAGLDAGLVYNEFPTMGGRLVPPTDELLDRRYAQRADKGDTWWRNMLENPVTAQFDHRLFVSLWRRPEADIRPLLPFPSCSHYHFSLEPKLSAL
jgi:cytochrome c oxidase assembly protein subunit 15